MSLIAFNHRRVVPGFRLSLGYTLLYLTLLVLIPLAALVLKSAQLTFGQFIDTITDPFVYAAFRLSFQASLASALINSVFGLIVAWVLVRYRFPGRRLFDAVVDFPFALPTAVAGLTFGSLYSNALWIDDIKIGTWITDLTNWLLRLIHAGSIGAETLSGLDESRVILMLTFVGLPFVVRTVQPVLQDFDPELEQAARSLGASRWTIFRRVVFADVFPAWLSGLALAFARAVGEYGSVIFVAGNIPGKSQIAPVQIVTKLDEYEYSQATSIAVVLLGVSLLILVMINGLDWWSRRHERT